MPVVQSSGSSQFRLPPGGIEIAKAKIMNFAAETKVMLSPIANYMSAIIRGGAPLTEHAHKYAQR